MGVRLYFLLMTEQQAQLRLASLCAKGEHCTQEMLEKLRKWEIEEDAQARIMAYLTEHHFIDDSRFCEAFVKDKIQYNGWGRRKVFPAVFLTPYLTKFPMRCTLKSCVPSLNISGQL